MLAVLFPQSILSQEKGKYRILSIDSTENYYFVKVRKGFKICTVLSKKVEKNENENEKIKLKKKYEMSLIKYSPNKVLLEKADYFYSIEGRIVWSTNRKYKTYTSNCLVGLNPRCPP